MPYVWIVKSEDVIIRIFKEEWKMKQYVQHRPSLTVSKYRVD